MKKRFKLGLGLAALFFGVVTLSSCTASFCTVKDQGRMLYAVESGVTQYYKEGTQPEETEELKVKKLDDFEDVYYTVSYSNSTNLQTVITQGTSNKIVVPGKNQLEFFAVLDESVLNQAWEKEYGNNVTIKNYDNLKSALHEYGYLKFLTKDGTELWDNFEKNWDETATKIYDKYGSFDYVPSTDFKTLYKSTLTTTISSYRSCLTTVTGDYGSYGTNNSIIIEAKNYGDAWNKGFFEGLLVWPIGAFIDVLAQGFGYNVATATPTNGVPQILAIIVVTVIIRLIMVLLTWKQTMGNAKMNEIQPEVSKIQAKYPNANTNQYEKQRMAEEMQKLYKKNKINPFSTILVMIVQFPVFICVWGALSGSAILTTGTFLGLDLGLSISTVLFNGANWTAAGGYGAVTALFLFLLMGGAQAVAMLLPQWIQKKKAKNVAKLGKNPAANSQANKMKWVTYIMLAMIIFMGFSLVSAMGVYWLIGALFSIAQTLATQYIQDRKAKQKKN